MILGMPSVASYEESRQVEAVMLAATDSPLPMHAGKAVPAMLALPQGSVAVHHTRLTSLGLGADESASIVLAVRQAPERGDGDFIFGATVIGLLAAIGLLLAFPKKEPSRQSMSARRAKARQISKGLAKRLVEFGRV